MDKIALYIKESYNEMVNKVTWPTWSMLLDSTRVVVIFTIILSAIIFIMDSISGFITDMLYNL